MSTLVQHGAYQGQGIVTARGEIPGRGVMDYVATVHTGKSGGTVVEVWSCRWYAGCGNDAVVIVSSLGETIPTCARCAQRAGIDMGQPTPEEDRANGTVSAANVPAPDAAHNPDVEDFHIPDSEAAGEVRQAIADGTLSGLSVSFKVSDDEPDVFAPTSDEPAANVEHVPYVEDPDESAEPSSTPVFDGTPNVAAVDRDPALGWEVDKRA